MANSLRFNEDFSLKGKNAIITGASSGIGAEIAKMFIRKGANVVGFDLNQPANMTEYTNSTDDQFFFYSGDITKPESIEGVVQFALQKFGKINVLVNCAGVGILEPVAESTQKVWDLTLAVDLSGCVNLAIAVGKTMIANGGGSIINIASQAGVIALEGHLAYGTAKAGLIQATKQIAIEWGQYHVRVNAISPGVILTPMGEKNWNNEKGELFKQKVPSRRFGYPEEVAACAVYLASDAASFINGSNLMIDGGYTVV